jgi:hypothetical protein
VTEGASVTRRKKTHRHKGCGWLASRRGSKYTKKNIVKKDVVGLLLGEVVSMKKKHILAKDVVGLLAGGNEDLLIISQN